MNNLRFKFLTFVLILMCSSVQALDVPTLQNRVTDLAGLISSATLHRLESQLQTFERETSNQIAVLIIPSLEGESLEDYSHRVAETWKLGQQGKDNGVLLLIAKNDRKLRIEVGYGLESSLTDALSNHIIQNEIVPYFKSGDFETGIAQGVTTIIGAIQNTYQPDLDADPNADMPLSARFFMFAIWFFVVGIHSSTALFNKSAIASIFHFIFLLPFWFAFPYVIFGPALGIIVFLIFLIGFPMMSFFLRITESGRQMLTALQTKRSSRNNYWYSGFATGSSGHSGSSGFSSSSFSGGGGSFGGGGSSGSW